MVAVTTVSSRNRPLEIKLRNTGLVKSPCVAHDRSVSADSVTPYLAVDLYVWRYQTLRSYRRRQQHHDIVQWN